MSITIELSTSEARFLHVALGQIAGFTELRAMIEAKLPVDNLVRCHYCTQVQGSERAYVGHLIEMHHCLDNPYGEDTAQTEAWQAFHKS